MSATRSHEDFYLWGNECPLDQVVGKGTIEINPNSSNCTGIAKAIDASGDMGKSLSQTSVFGSSFNPKRSS